VETVASKPLLLAVGEEHPLAGEKVIRVAALEVERPRIGTPPA
jgi:hypothetical protein